MRNARIFALLVALCLSLASVASASSVGPLAVKNSGSPKSSAIQSMNVPSGFTCLYCANQYFYGSTNAWTINYGFAVSDSFVLASPGVMNAAAFLSWDYPYTGNVTGVDWAVGTAPDTANVASGHSISMSNVYFGTNDYGYNLDGNYFGTAPVSLNAETTYWFTLYNATNTYGYAVYWDQNSGPSQAWESYYGYLGPICGVLIPGPVGGTCSQTFYVANVTGATPEPASLLLFGSGLLGLGGVIRRRLGR